MVVEGIGADVGAVGADAAALVAEAAACGAQPVEVQPALVAQALVCA